MAKPYKNVSKPAARRPNPAMATTPATRRTNRIDAAVEEAQRGSRGSLEKARRPRAY
jgi:hypothetical protein